MARTQRCKFWHGLKDVGSDALKLLPVEKRWWVFVRVLHWIAELKDHEDRLRRKGVKR